MTTSTSTPYTADASRDRLVTARGGDTFMVFQDKTPATEPWVDRFRIVYRQAVEGYEQGVREPAALFAPADAEFLASLGATPQEIFDFVEDWCDDGEPDPETVLGITALRREYFLKEQQGRPTGRRQSLDAFPPRDAALEGWTWLPRIIAKGRAKLRGELPADLMYGCAGDRRFLKQVRVDPVEFLDVVRKAGEDVAPIVQFVKERARS